MNAHSRPVARLRIYDVDLVMRARKPARHSRIAYTAPIGPRRPTLCSYAEPIGPSIPVPASAGPVSARMIAANVCHAHKQPFREIVGPIRFAPVVLARQEVMWRLHHELGWSKSRIGRFLGRDHSTAWHGIRKHQARLDAGHSA